MSQSVISINIDLPENKTNARLDWPVERNPVISESYPAWHDQGANRMMDFHGSPVNPDLILFSDGNHHMALMEAVQRFEQEQSCAVFYLTLPPALLLRFAQAGGVCIGNLCLPLEANVFIGPDIYLDKLATRYELFAKKKFSTSAGCSIVSRKGEPLAEGDSPVTIKGLITSGKRLFISHPENETASYDVYRQTLINMAVHEGLPETDVLNWLSAEAGNIVYGQDVHHREVPLALIKNIADFSLVYHHLALRYARIFPDQLDYQPLYSSGSSQVSSLHVCTEYFVSTLKSSQGLPVKFYQHMQSSSVADIYTKHGLLV